MQGYAHKKAGRHTGWQPYRVYDAVMGMTTDTTIALILITNINFNFNYWQLRTLAGYSGTDITVSRTAYVR